MTINALAIQDYALLDDDECNARIVTAKEQLGKRCIIFAHHYQRNEVFKHADVSGDALKLSRQVAESEAEYSVFCGVHYMAEVADILLRPGQIAILPNLAAGCSMADMANRGNVERCWQELSQWITVDNTVMPVTHIHSTANLKAFCGRHQGIVCTSSNARRVLDWSFAQREKVLFFPDQHLGRNTGYGMGIALDEMVVWDFDKPMGGLSEAEIIQAKIILWKGFCSVHQTFRPEQIDAFLAQYPETQIIAHPEACFEVCEKSDYVGSTEYILETVRTAEPNTRWLVGTELNLVNRLNEECRKDGKQVHFMSSTVSMCSTMFRTNPQHLAWVLENLLAGHVVNQIRVAESDAVPARWALDNMLNLA